MASKFEPDVANAFVDLISEGFTIRDASRTIEVSEKTVKGWLTRGRNEESGEYTDFAKRVGEARQQFEDAEGPMDEDELLLAVSRAAKKGSVGAQKLLWEMIRARDPDGDEKPADPFEELDDELAPRRKTA